MRGAGRRWLVPVWIGVWLLLGMAGGLVSRPAHGQDGEPQAGFGAPLVHVVVELIDEPVVAVYLAGQADGEISTAALAELTQVQLAAVEAQQVETLVALADAGIDYEVLYRNQRVYNGMGLMVDAARIEEVAGLPQVAAVHPLILKSPSTSISVPHLHAPELWSRPEGGLTGKGIRIAIIDTGIDYLHTAFGGPGTGYLLNDTRVIGDVPNFPGPKVVGGWDFAGDAYNADPEAESYAPIPAPNPDPMDCYAPGHGTHVAAIAGGYGVTSTGATYAGPYTAGLAQEEFRIGPGVAPGAQLFALKVFGCQGRTALVDAAIEWAIDPNRDGDFSDRMDVINLSLGSSYGAPYDSTTIAADAAARLGVVVVASAGNSGDTVYAVGSPGIGEAVIAAAATRFTATVCNPPPCTLPEQMAEFSSRGPRRVDALLKPDLAAPGFSIMGARAGGGNSGLSLSGTSMAAPHVAGAAALLLQAMHNQAAEEPVLWQPSDIKPRLMNTARPAIPAPFSGTGSVAYAPVRVGAGSIDLEQALGAFVVAHDAQQPWAVSVSFGAPGVVDRLDQSRTIQLSNRSGQPISFTVGYEAVVAAPGVTITIPSADPETGQGVVMLGAYGTATVGLALEANAAEMAYVRDPALPGEVAFPRHWLTESSGYVVFMPYEDGEDRDGEDGDGETNGPAHPPLRVPVYAAPQPAAHLQALPPALEIGKAVEITRTIHLVGENRLGQAAQGATSAPTPPERPVALAGLVELHHISGRKSSFSGLPAPTFAHADLQYVGARHLAQAGMGVQVEGENGGAENFETGQAAWSNAVDERGLVVFGISTHGPWSTLNEVEFNVWIDVTGDRQADFRLFNSDLSSFQNGLWSEVRGGDVFVVALEELATGERVMADFVNGASAAVIGGGMYDTNVVMLPVAMQRLGWDAEQGDVYYRITTYSRTFGNHPLRSPVVDATPWLRLQVVPHALEIETVTLASAPDSPLFPAATDSGDSTEGSTGGSTEGSAPITVRYRVTDYVRSRPPALLLFHFHNQPDRRVEVLPIRYALPFEQFLPYVETAPPLDSTN